MSRRPAGDDNLPDNVTSRMIDDAAGPGDGCDGGCEPDGQQQHVPCDAEDGDPDCCMADESGRWLCASCWIILHPHSAWGDESDSVHGKGCPECDKIEAANAVYLKRAREIIAERAAIDWTENHRPPK